MIAFEMLEALYTLVSRVHSVINVLILMLDSWACLRHCTMEPCFFADKPTG